MMKDTTNKGIFAAVDCFSRRGVRTGDDKLSNLFARGFTLIELLVVISIIALLLSIMLPSLQKARSYSYQVICSSNIRNLGMSWRLYANDNSDLMPPRRSLYRFSGNGGARWTNFIARYTSDSLTAADTVNTPYKDSNQVRISRNGPFVCPGFKSVQPNTYTALWPHFGINYFVNDINLDENGKSVYGGVKGWHKVSNVPRVGETIIFVDSAYPNSGIRAGYAEASGITFCRDQVIGEDPYRMAGSEYGVFPKEYARLLRHSGGSNVAFCDGHVKRLTWDEMDLSNPGNYGKRFWQPGAGR